MPELPEVETLRRGLAGLLPGRVVRHAELGLPKLLAVAPPDGLAVLVGRPVEGIERHGKLLGLRCGPWTLLVHLRLTGQLVFVDGGTRFAGGHPVPPFDAPVPGRMTHLALAFDRGALYLNDQRQFARVWLLPAAEAAAFVGAQALGPSPLDATLTPQRLAERLARHARLPLKGALLDQRTLAGLGNIYADESLFLAGLHPARLAGALGPAEGERLLGAMRRALAVALEHGGAMVINGRAVPAPGKDFLLVHGRAGQPCRACGTLVLKERIAGRGTYFCPRCQV